MKRVLKSLLSGVIVGSMILNCVSVFANQSQVVKVSIGSTVANVNGYDTTLTFAPYIQQPSDSMMIPLRFVSTGLGIDESNIEYNPNTKEITITYNGTTAKFIVGTNKLILNGEEFSMLIENTHPVYTEIKNGSTFIPLRSLELTFGVKIDWEASTKTAILTNKIEDNKTTNQAKEPIVQDNSSLSDNNITEDTNLKENTIKTFEDYTDEEVRAMEEEVVRLVNEERAKYGLHPLEIDETLMELSKEKSKDMANNNYFSHTSPTYGSPFDMIKNSGITYNFAGENIASMGMSSQGVVNGWLNSKGHRENILNPNYKYIGVGVYNSKWTQIFIG